MGDDRPDDDDNSCDCEATAAAVAFRRWACMAARMEWPVTGTGVVVVVVGPLVTSPDVVSIKDIGREENTGWKG